MKLESSRICIHVLSLSLTLIVNQLVPSLCTESFVSPKVLPLCPKVVPIGLRLTLASQVSVSTGGIGIM